MDTFNYSPGPIVIDGLNAVPIHIDRVEATIQFDGSTKSAHCDAEMQFMVGPDAGYPYFDLRQTVGSASLDGSPIPVSDLVHHSFGGGPNADLRIIDRWLAASSTHTLTLSYNLDTPDAPNSRGLVWESDSSRLSFDFHLSDLNPARYLESWLPSNLLFDRFPVSLDIQIANTTHRHTLLSNGAVTNLGTDHWRIEFPAEFATCSPLLLIEATDRVELHSAPAALSGGTTVRLDLMKRASDPSLSLSSAASTLAGYLNDFHTGVGSYMHGSRFVGYLTSGPTHSMEYNGGTTSSMSALKHEAFHSWWARGMIPAHGEDGWLDEAWTTYNTQGGGPHASPLDFSDPPVALWTNNPFIRRTHGSSYIHGSRVFAGIAADLGISSLLGHMAGIYRDRIDGRFTTPEVEAELIRRSGSLHLARHFDRFVYGFPDPDIGTQPDLYMRDASDDPGSTSYSGTFWRSPDIWVRNADDDETTHQDPESGQDNWLYARVHNRGTATAHSFVVGFKINVWAGTQFVYPGDWFPLTAAVVGFNLIPGHSQIVKARWPKDQIPPAETHGCLLSLVYSPHDSPATGAHVWEHNNLAQRNLRVVDLEPDEWAEIEFWLGSQFSWGAQFHQLELRRPTRWREIEALITHRRPTAVEGLFRSFERFKGIQEPQQDHAIEILAPTTIRFGKNSVVLKPAPDSKMRVVKSRWQAKPWSGVFQAVLVRDVRRGLAIRYDSGSRARFPVASSPGQRRSMVLRLQAPQSARPGDQIPIDLMQRDANGRVIGGFTVLLNITDRNRRNK